MRGSARRDGGDVVIVSHQLPIWMVHHRSWRAIASAHDPRQRRCALSSITTLRAAAAARFVEVGYTRPGRTTLARRPPTWEPCDGVCATARTSRRHRALAAGIRRLLLTGCASDPLADQYREGSGKNYIAGDGTITEIAARRTAASRSSSRARPSRATPSRSADYARRGARRQLLVRRLRALPRRGADPRGRQPGVRRRRRRASLGVNVRDQAGTAPCLRGELRRHLPVGPRRQRRQRAARLRRRRCRRTPCRPRSCSTRRAASPRASSASSRTRRSSRPSIARHRRRERLSVSGVGEIVLNGQLLARDPDRRSLAGLVSFLSPCVLPLVPGYLGYLGGFTEMPRPTPPRSGATAVACCSASRCSSPGSRSSSSPRRCCSGSPARWLDGVRRRDHRACSASSSS